DQFDQQLCRRRGELLAVLRLAPLDAPEGQPVLRRALARDLGRVRHRLGQLRRRREGLHVEDQHPGGRRVGDVRLELRPELRDERIGLIDDDKPAVAEERDRVQLVTNGGKVGLVAGKGGHGVLWVGLADDERYEQRQYAAFEEVLVAGEHVERLPLRLSGLVDEAEGVHYRAGGERYSSTSFFGAPMSRT